MSFSDQTPGSIKSWRKKTLRSGAFLPASDFYHDGEYKNTAERKRPDGGVNDGQSHGGNSMRIGGARLRSVVGNGNGSGLARRLPDTTRGPEGGEKGRAKGTAAAGKTCAPRLRRARGGEENSPVFPKVKDR